MENIFKTFGKYLMIHKVWLVILGIIAIVIISYFSFGGREDNLNFVLAKKGNIREEVSVTGRVRAFSEVDLAFERGGRVSNIYVAVGDQVYSSQSLASVSNTDLLANLAQAEANLKKALAQYQDIQKGTRAEEINLQETQVAKANQDLAQAKNSLANSIKDSYTKADDALRNKIFSLFIDPVKYRARLAFTTDNFLREDIEEGKDKMVEDLDSWYRSLQKMDSDFNVDTYYNTAKSNLESIKALLNKSAQAVNSLSPDDFTNQNSIDIWKANISSARTSIDTAISSLTSSYNNFKTAMTGLQLAEDQLAIKKAGSTSGALLSAEASYESAQASVDLAKSELTKSIIRSPINGVITKIPVKLGEIVPMNQKAISVISFDKYEVEVFIPEADFAKIKIGQEAKTTLDAYGSETVFITKVLNIEPAATIIDGVPTYKVILQFTIPDERIRVGMTANLDILTAQKEEVIIIPQRIIYTKDGLRLVKVIKVKNIIEERIVEVGQRGSDGFIEIVSGLNEGDKVVANI